MRTHMEKVDDAANRNIAEDGANARPLTAEEAEAMMVTFNTLSLALHGEKRAWNGWEEKWEAKKAGDPVARLEFALSEAFDAALCLRDAKRKEVTA
jgi:hypothetical protein